MPSIRKQLLLWLMSGLACGILLVLWVAYVVVRNEIGHTFDDELKQIARAVHVREDWIKSGRVRIARPGFSFAVRAFDYGGHAYFETVLPVLPPDVPHFFTEGYHFVQGSDDVWRVYTYVTPEGVVQVGQPLATRDALARHLSLRVILPMLLLIPVLASVVLWGLRRGLAVLTKTTQRVAERDASLLHPLPTADVPQELLPLVEQINGLMARLSQALDGQRQFLADAAHELRTPVAALTLQAQLAERAATEAARQTAFAELKGGIERAIRLVQQLLDYARLEPGIDQEPAENVDLARVARDIVGSYAARADTVDVDLGADTPPSCRVRGSETQLRSMIANLTDNALRYAPRGSSVTLAVQCSQENITLDIADCGPGIPPPERERVFRRFHRVPGDRTPGNGLGLSIVKAIVQRHHGTLTLEDANSGAQPPGLRVRITLPLEHAEPNNHLANEEDISEAAKGMTPLDQPS